MLTSEGLGKRIRKTRENLGFTQDDLAQKLGIKRELVSRIENGKRTVNYLEMKVIAEFLGMTPDELVAVEEEDTTDLVTLFMQSGCTDEVLMNNIKEIQDLIDVLLGQERLYQRICESDNDGDN